MMKRNFWIGLAIVAVLVIGGYFLLHNSYPTNTNSSSGQAATSSPSGAIIQTKNNSSVGQYLADSNGNTLYTYGQDTPGVSNCSGGCISNWPIYSANAAPASLPANVTVVKRADGGSQYAYKGLPLYTFTSDATGKVTGDNVANFHIAKP